MGLTRELKRVIGLKPRRRERAGQLGPLPPREELLRLGLRLPNFFIAGAARCGTTSLWQYLRQHPDIFMPPVFETKEPSYFCDLYGMKDWWQYTALFAAANGQRMIGEASGPYLTSPESPLRIRDVIPEARFIISLRNPVERAFSLFKWMRENGYEPCDSFEKALRLENEERLANENFIRGNGQYYHNFLYFNSGLYASQVERFFRVFGRENVCVIIFEEFTRDPHATVRQVFQFLGVNADFKPQIAVHNATSSASGALEGRLRNELAARYRPSVLELEALLGRELQHLWR